MSFVDTGELALISDDNLLHFFLDESVFESSSGSVARIRVYDESLSAQQVAGLDRLAPVVFWDGFESGDTSAWSQ